MNSMKATIDRFEGEKAVLIIEGGHQAIIDRKILPANSKEGQVVYLTISHDDKETADKENMAKNILKEILKKPDA